MGRFDALTHLEDQPKKPAPSPVVSSPTAKKPPAQQTKQLKNEEKKPEIMKSRNPDTHSPTDSVKEKPQKYSTLLDANLINRLNFLQRKERLKITK
jgi:hypothetical protein